MNTTIDTAEDSSSQATQSLGGADFHAALGSAANAKLGATRKARIAIIDDEPYNILIVKKHLQKAGYSNFVTTEDSTEALKLMRTERPDVLLLDILMPKVSGLDILHAMQHDPKLQHIPVLIMTATSEMEVKRICLDLGAADFLPKPLDPIDLVPRVRNTLASKLAHDRLTAHASQLEVEVARRTSELAASREEIVHCLARAAEFRDDDTGHHVIRVGKYVGVIAREMGFSDAQVEVIELAAQLHDLGKIAIPDAILHKPGKLDDCERSLMQRHCGLGRQVLNPLSPAELRTLQKHARLGADLLHVTSSPLLMLASKIAQTHHEWWDGNGYPLGLKGNDIPIEGRMTAVADVYDALSSARPYKKAFPREKCFAILKEDSGTHFDPEVVDAFFRRADEIIEIQMQFMDPVQPPKQSELPKAEPQASEGEN